MAILMTLSILTSPRRTTPKRIAWGVIAAAATGSILVGLPFLVLLPFVMLVAAPVWALGVLVLGLPVWRLLGRWGINSLPVAIALGAVLTASAFITFALINGPAAEFSEVDGKVLVANGRRTWAGLQGALGAAMALSVAGGLAGCVGWLVAYRPGPKPAVTAEAFR